MPLGFYIAGVASQMAQYKLNDISHNLANINTTGYLASHASFSTQFSGQLAGGSAQTPAAFSRYNNQFIDMREGSIKNTGNVLDFALRGHAFFRIGLADGTEAYTRAGNFKLDSNGTLLTQEGHPVLDKRGSSIQLPPGQITASQEGMLESSNVNSILAMAELIDTMRSYKSTMKIVEQFNQQEALLTDKVGHIQG